MAAIDELCAFGFDRFWVSQALELTNNHKDYALEWLLSDEFKLSKQAMEEQKKKAPVQQKQRTPSPPPPPAFQMPLQLAPKEPPPVLALPAYHSESLSLPLTLPGADEVDYRVSFASSLLGLQLTCSAEARSMGSECVVEQCLGKTAKRFVDAASLVVAVGDVVVLGMAYAETLLVLRHALLSPPVTLRLRAKKKRHKRRGFLKVKVVRGVRLKQRGSHCLVQVGNAKLSSAKLDAYGDTQPLWNETLIFKNFRPNAGKTAVITVYSHKNGCVGRAECVLPTEFNRLHSEAPMLTLQDELCGIIQLHVVIVDKHTV